MERDEIEKLVAENIQKSVKRFDDQNKRLDRLYNQVDRVLESAVAAKAAKYHPERLAVLVEQQRKILRSLVWINFPQALIDKLTQAAAHVLGPKRGEISEYTARWIASKMKENERPN